MRSYWLRGAENHGAFSSKGERKRSKYGEYSEKVHLFLLKISRWWKNATFSSRKPLFFEMNDLPLRLIKHNFPFPSAALRRLYSAFRRAYPLLISANDLWFTVRWTISYRCVPSGEGDTVGFAKVAIPFSKKWHEVSISCCVCFLWSNFSAFMNCGCLQQKVPERIKKMHSGLLIIGLSSVFSPWAVQFALRLEHARFSAYRKRQIVSAL